MEVKKLNQKNKLTTVAKLDELKSIKKVNKAFDKYQQYRKDNLFNLFDDMEYSNKENRELYSYFRQAINHKIKNVNIDHHFRAQLEAYLNPFNPITLQYENVDDELNKTIDQSQEQQKDQIENNNRDARTCLS